LGRRYKVARSALPEVIDCHNHIPSGEFPMVTVGTDAASCAATLAAAKGSVYAAIGCHPNNAEQLNEAQLRRDAAHPRCVAIGETGLDYYRDGAPRAVQLRAFEFHIALARELDKTLVIHTREAADDTLAVLHDQAQGLRVQMLEAGWWISFAGNVTYPKNAELAAAAARVPAERLLVETDAPYLAPQSRRGKPNEPAFVRETAEFIAALRGISYEQLEAIVTASAGSLFRW
jgi:TatD DNase family protein